MKETCMLDDCDKPAKVRKLCSLDYQKARRAGTLDEISPRPSTSCAHCNQPIPPGRWWGARFCSHACKQAFYPAARHAEVMRKRSEQRCAHCGGPIALDAGTRVQTCSKACGVAWQNTKRQAAKRAAWLATVPACQRCGEPIPESRPRNCKYCSPECKKREMDARWRARAPHYNREYKYGINGEQYEAMLAAQDSACAVCGSSEWPGKDNRPHVDHDHATKAVRGILCGNCNNGLGMFGDDPARLRAAADYLERAAATARMTLF